MWHNDNEENQRRHLEESINETNLNETRTCLLCGSSKWSFRNPLSRNDDSTYYCSDQNCTEMKNDFLNCVSDGLTSEVVAFLEKGVDVNTSYDMGGYTALMMAAMNGHINIARILLSRGANCQLKSADGKKTAIEMCESKSMKALLKLSENQM